jgi:hypothetical protein
VTVTMAVAIGRAVIAGRPNRAAAIDPVGTNGERKRPNGFSQAKREKYHVEKSGGPVAQRSARSALAAGADARGGGGCGGGIGGGGHVGAMGGTHVGGHTRAAHSFGRHGRWTIRGTWTHATLTYLPSGTGCLAASYMPYVRHIKRNSVAKNLHAAETGFERHDQSRGNGFERI